MRNHARPRGERFGRAVTIGLGALGALDALALFVFLLVAATFVAPLGPYIGILLFVVVPSIMVIGGALAWAGYEAWMERPEELYTAHEAADGGVTYGRHPQA
jgi:hypothetical protein